MLNTDIAYGFLDESSSLKQKDFFFCVSIISTEERTNKRLMNVIKNARKRIVDKKLKNFNEFKFYHADERIRQYVLSELVKQDIKIVACIVDKEGRRVEDTPQNYGIVVGATIAEFLSIYPSLNLTVDKKYTSPHQQQQFIDTSIAYVNTVFPEGARVYFHPPVDSKKDSIIQLSDFVAGAMNAKYNRGEDKYVQIIKSKIVKETVVKWTEIKKRIVNP